jgi:hypothetical protein
LKDRIGLPLKLVYPTRAVNSKKEKVAIPR